MLHRSAIQISLLSLLSILITLPLSTAYALSGKEVYMQNCVACHGASGKGTLPNAPDFTNSKGVLMKSDQALLDYIATNRPNPGSTRTMPAKGGNPNLTNQELKESLTYIRQTFGKNSVSVKKKLNETQHSNTTTLTSSPPISADAARGASAWATTCSGCHNARSPSSLSAAQWHTVMLHMRRQAHLTGQQTRDILTFLQNSSQ